MRCFAKNNKKGAVAKQQHKKNGRGVSQLSFFAVKWIYENQPTAKGL
jgi:hypothetical protein